MATSSSILVVVSLFCLATLPYPTSCSTNNTDYLSLLELKKVITDDPLGALNSWNKTTNFCSWEGIQCGGRRHPDRVVAIYLNSQGLVGSLSPSIGNMSFLRVINLQNNSFHGIIPNEIGSLRRLEVLEFSNNSFGGALPKNLTQCPNLFYLNLIDNEFFGSIPSEFGLLSKMEKLGLAKNNLSGQIPLSFGNLTSLTMLSLVRCNLVGQIPESLGRLRNLEYLWMSENGFTGTIPTALLNISTILAFDVSINQLHGSIPSNIGLKLPNLISLSLGHNQFAGAVPASLANASSLETIILTKNNFSGKMPMLGKLSNLRLLALLHIPIQDDINFISPLVNCTNLEVLEMGPSLVSGSLPGSIGNFSDHLSALMIQCTLVDGNIPSSIGNLVGLTELHLLGNNLEGFIPSSIAQLSNLYVLDFTANRLSGKLPYSVGNITSLTKLFLRQNQLSGSIPKSLNHCTSLLSLDLAYNNLSGPIPPEIMNLSSLSDFLDLSFNYLTNTLPSGIYSLTHLSKIDFSNNRLSGAIPNSLSSCTSLVHLHLEGNLFDGNIPQGLSALKGLQDLDLSRNQFSGLIPSFLGELQLERLNLSFNKLQGVVPKLGVFKNHSAISVEGNNDLCGGILELKLPPCALPNSSKKNSQILLKVLIPVCVACFVCLSLFLYKKRKLKKDLSSSPNFSPAQLLRLSYAILLKATNAFSEANLVGVGRFASVYKGILEDGQTLIAVKVLNLLVRGASKSFLKECNALRHIRHRNLLKILSVCESIDFKGTIFKALVYEFKSHGSLDKWMHRNFESHQGIDEEEEVGKLDITQRLNIAIDVAHALEYLHCGTESTIIHGDLKPSNILLDDDMTACVGDFGLARVISSIIPLHQNSSSTGIRGTIGYVPPEYGTSNLMSALGDVYSYGILVLEIFTNRRPTDNVFKDHLNIHNFVSAALPDCIGEVVDPRVVGLRDDMNDEKVKDLLVSVLRIGVVCSKENPNDRISMTEVVNVLRQIKDEYSAK